MFGIKINPTKGEICTSSALATLCRSTLLVALDRVSSIYNRVRNKSVEYLR